MTEEVTLELSNETPQGNQPAALSFDAQQKDAVERCCDIRTRVWPVTGPAGTGKTTIIKEIYHRLVSLGRRPIICTFMGKAAKRVQEATGLNAITIHRLLEFPHPRERDPDTGQALRSTEPKRDRFNPIEYDCVIVDEYAVVGWELHRFLMDAIPHGGLVRVFGDINQLKPVEKNSDPSIPSPFEKLLKDFKGTKLDTIHRQGEGSGIVANANLILAKRLPLRRPDFDLMFTDNPVKVLEEYVLRKQEAGVNYGTLDNQIITPANKTWVGAHKLNAVLQPLFTEGSRDDYKLPRHPWDKDEHNRLNSIYLRPGDKIINTQNNYDLELFNGEVGIVLECTDYGEVVADFGDRHVTIPPIQLVEYQDEQRTFYPQKDIYLAYALTTHKCQGSEYDNVVYVLNKSNIYGQERANFYTAVTRGRKHVTIVTDQRSLSYSVNANETAMSRKNRK